MSVFDVANPPLVPDSTLDSDMAKVQTFPIQAGLYVPIAPGDWVDVDPSCLPPDPTWGSSFQVSNVYPDENENIAAVGILITEDAGETYFETSLSAKAWIQNNYRRVQNV